jgi:hypothetical protein
MPLPLKTLREVSIQLGISESEIRSLIDLKKVRAVLKKTGWMFAPDEIASIARQRRTAPDTVVKSNLTATPSPAKPAPPKKPSPPRRGGR